MLYIEILSDGILPLKNKTDKILSDQSAICSSAANHDSPGQHTGTERRYMPQAVAGCGGGREKIIKSARLRAQDAEDRRGFGGLAPEETNEPLYAPLTLFLPGAGGMVA